MSALIAAYLTVLLWVGWQFVTAPYGWQDERGWHAGFPPGEDDL